MDMDKVRYSHPGNFSTVAATAETSIGLLLVFLAFKWHRSSIILLAFTLLIMWYIVNL